MKIFKISILTLVLMVSFISCEKSKEASQTGQNITGQDTKLGDPVKGDRIKVPLIAWGADLVTINANGKNKITMKGSLFDQEGLNIELFREDDFSRQVDLFIKGEIVFLRGTMGMINMASERLNASDKTKPVLIYQHSWSAGGDALVVKGNINSIKDLKRKVVALQSYGPHVAYFLKLITDANLQVSDVKIVWTKDLIGPEGNTPMAKLRSSNIDAAFVIIPDALALTSNGSVGTGAEDSIKGARILLSTKTANRIISDVYAVRKDYFAKNRSKIKKFVKALLKSEEEIKDIFKNKNTGYNEILKAGGKLLLDDAGAVEDIKGMYMDAELAGFNGNVKFFEDMNFLRNHQHLTKEIQMSLISLGLISKRSKIDVAHWDYKDLRSGLRYADKYTAQRFDVKKVAVIAEKASRTDSSLFSFEIFFSPNQNSFSASMYSDEFEKVINLAATYGGSLIIIEGHSDPMSYLRKKKNRADQIVLKKIKQSAKNLSYSRASSVRKEIIDYAALKKITIDPSQFTIIGRGIDNPKFKVPENKNEWKQNMRVKFKIIQVEAEEEVFRPLD